MKAAPSALLPRRESGHRRHRASASSTARRQIASRRAVACAHSSSDAASAEASDPFLFVARLKRPSSPSPINGDLRRHASVRSSSGVSATRPAARRSITAIWSRSFSRSAPATFTRLVFSARIIASKKALRLRTRIITSPGRIRRGSPVLSSTTRSRESGCSHRPTRSAIRPARTTGGSSRAGSSSGMRQSSGSGASAGLTVGHSSTTPAISRRIAS